MPYNSAATACYNFTPIGLSQVYAGVAYKATTWLDASVGYRYLAFDGGSKTAGVEKLSLGGVILGGNIHF